MLVFHIDDFNVHQRQNIWHGVFSMSLTAFLRCPDVSGGVLSVNGLLAHFDKQLPVVYFFNIFLQCKLTTDTIETKETHFPLLDVDIM